MGYGGRSSKESVDLRTNQIELLHKLAQEQSALIYSVFIDEIKEDKYKNLSGGELLALATFTGTLFTGSTVFSIYYDLIDRDSQLEKLYSEEDIEKEIIKSFSHYIKQIITSMKNTRQKPDAGVH